MNPVSPTHQQFIENCRDIVSRQSHVVIREAALEAFAKTIKTSSFVPDWKDYISAAANSTEKYDFKRAFYEFAIIVSQQGGFIFEDDTGAAQKWQKDGSGAKAMVEKMAEIRTAGALPFYDISETEVEQKIKPLLIDVPFAEKRLKIFKELASAQKHKEVMDLLDAAFDGKKYTMDMVFVEALASILPESFGDDIFMKKCMLTPLMAAANASHHGVQVDTADLLPAIDYILPQVLNADHINILSFDTALTEKLQKKQALHEDSEEVAAMRAATALVCDKLMQLSGLSAQEVDGFLWLAGRKLQGARPHMMCYTARF